MIADMSVSKAEGLANVTKDAAAIESGASRGLRTLGPLVDLKKEVQRQEKLTGKTLDENVILQLRYNAVMREAAKIQGAAVAASGSAAAQSKALVRKVNELREAIGWATRAMLAAGILAAYARTAPSPPGQPYAHISAYSARRSPAPWK